MKQMILLLRLCLFMLQQKDHLSLECQKQSIGFAIHLWLPIMQQREALDLLCNFLLVKQELLISHH